MSVTINDVQGLVDAVEELDKVWTRLYTWEQMGSFTCSEANTLYEVFFQLGLLELASKIYDGHCIHDEDDDDADHVEHRDAMQAAHDAFTAKLEQVAPVTQKTVLVLSDPFTVVGSFVYEGD
jgi:hypothetical protein